MAVGLIILLIGAGVGTSWAAASGLWRASGLEVLSGALLIVGLALLGLSMPIAQHLTAG